MVYSKPDFLCIQSRLSVSARESQLSLSDDYLYSDVEYTEV